MKITRFLSALVLAATAFAQQPKNVQKVSDGTNAITESLVIGDGKTLSASGTGTVTATSVNGTSATLSGNLTVAGSGYFNGGYAEIQTVGGTDGLYFKNGSTLRQSITFANSKTYFNLGSGSANGFVFNTYGTANALTLSNAGNLTAIGIVGTPIGASSPSTGAFTTLSASSLSLTTPLAVANGGTGVATSTGTGSAVLSNSPALVTPNIGAATGTSVNLTGGGTFGGPLSVNSAATADIGSFTSSDTNANIKIKSTATGAGASGFQLVAGGTGSVVSAGGFGLYDSTAGVTRLNVASNGYIGIGTASPFSKLNVQADGSTTDVGQFVICGATNTSKRFSFGFNTTSDYATIQALIAGVGYYPLAVQPNGGNVLVGTTTDGGYKLDVNGTARIQNNLAVSSTTASTSTTTGALQVAGGVGVAGAGYFGGNLVSGGYIRSTGTNGFQIGEGTGGQNRISYGVLATNTFAMLTSADAYANLGVGIGTFYSGQINLLDANVNLVADASNLKFQAYAGKGFVWNTGGTQKMALTNNGNFLVGVNSSDGVSTVQVSGVGTFIKDLSNPLDEDKWAVRIKTTTDNGGLYIGANDAYSAIQGINPGDTWGRNLALQPNQGNVLVGTVSDNGFGRLLVTGGIASTFDHTVNDAFVAIDTGTGGKTWQFGPASGGSATEFGFYNKTDTSYALKFSTTTATFAGSVNSPTGAMIASGTSTSTGYNNNKNVQLEGPSGRAIVNHDSGTASGTLYAGFGYNGSGLGSITQNGTSGVLYNTTSDARLKTNVRDFTNSGPIIDALKPRVFDWKSGDKDRYGFIAQEVYQTFPQAVKKGDDGEEVTDQWAMDASQLVPVLVAEIKALRARVQALESK